MIIIGMGAKRAHNSTNITNNRNESDGAMRIMFCLCVVYLTAL